VEFARQHLAGYKLPKHVLFVDEVRRAVNGKADYKWARATAESELA
jgi:acyl-CoA synthetase (AMP-forming)/AMP-acid ligase II